MSLYFVEKNLFKTPLTGIRNYSTDSKGRISIPSDLLKIISSVDKSNYFYTSLDGVFKDGIVIIPESAFEKLVPQSSFPSYDRRMIDSQNRVQIEVKNQKPAYVHGCGNFLLVYKEKLLDTANYFKKYIIEGNVHNKRS